MMILVGSWSGPHSPRSIPELCKHVKANQQSLSSPQQHMPMIAPRLGPPCTGIMTLLLPPPPHGVEKSRSDSSLLQKVALCFGPYRHVNLTQLTQPTSFTILTHVLARRKKPGVKMITQGLDMPQHIHSFPTTRHRSGPGPQNGKIGPHTGPDQHMYRKIF